MFQPVKRTEILVDAVLRFRVGAAHKSETELDDLSRILGG